MQLSVLRVGICSEIGVIEISRLSWLVVVVWRWKEATVQHVDQIVYARGPAT